MPALTSPRTRTVVLATGHEGVPPTEFAAARPGRDLTALLWEPTVVVPLTLGRDPDLTDAAAQTLRWAARDRPAGHVLLSPPLGTTTHLVSWLRAAATRAGAGPDRAILVAAPSASPEANAALFAAARMVREHGRSRLVEVALIGGDPDVAEGIERCLRLGAPSVAVLAAGFTMPDLPQDPRVVPGGPLFGESVLRRLIAERAAQAEHRFAGTGADGLAPTSSHHHHHH